MAHILMEYAGVLERGRIHGLADWIFGGLVASAKMEGGAP